MHIECGLKLAKKRKGLNAHWHAGAVKLPRLGDTQASACHLFPPSHTFQSHSETYSVDLEIQEKSRQALNSKSLKDKGQLLLPT